MNSIRGVQEVLTVDSVIFSFFLSVALVFGVAAAAKKSSVRSSVDVVRRSRSQGSVEGYWISGAIRRRRQLQRSVMQCCVERRIWVSVKGGCWRIDCWVLMDGDVVAASDSRKKIRYALHTC